MASKAPPIPPDQRSHPTDKPHLGGPHGDRRGRDDHSQRDLGRSGHQNTTHIPQQDR